MHETEIQSILRSKKIHWSIKANVMANYARQDPTMNLERIAFKLKTQFRMVDDYLKLAYLLQRYPQVVKIPTKSEVFQIVNNTPSEKLRDVINMVAVRYKNQIQLKEIKDEFNKNYIRMEGNESTSE
jgi:hypothetical protein